MRTILDLQNAIRELYLARLKAALLAHSTTPKAEVQALFPESHN